MKWSSRLILMSFILWGCSSYEKNSHYSDLNIVEINPNKWTGITKQNMLQLIQVYDLQPFLFTKNIQIQSQVIPHSHPVLTLNTRNAEHPKKILSAWLHEELHWWLALNQKETDLAVTDLKRIYPKAPTSKATGPDSTYKHLIVCYLELKALEYYLGNKEAVQVITELMKKDKLYPWVYYQVLYKDFAIKKVLQKHKLIPKVLEPNKKAVTLSR